MAAEKSTSETALNIKHEVSTAENALHIAITALKKAQELIEATEDNPVDHISDLENATGALKLVRTTVAQNTSLWRDRVSGRRSL